MPGLRNRTVLMILRQLATLALGLGRSFYNVFSQALAELYALARNVAELFALLDQFPALPDRCSLFLLRHWMPCLRRYSSTVWAQTL